MEYEIQDQGEDVLMDESTNPSLHSHYRQPKPRAVADRLADKSDRRALQKGELIPEEEEPQQPS